MIEVQSLSFSFDRDGEGILREVSCTFPKGSCTAVLGNNGAGKSTLLKCISRIYHPQGGAVQADGDDLLRLPRRKLARRVAYLPQSAEAPHILVLDAVLLGRLPYLQWDAAPEDRQIAAGLLRQFGLEGYAARYLDELSGGERQKVLLARAMAQQPDYLLLDEPTSSLDPHNQHQLLQTVRQLAEEQRVGVVIVIHDLNLAAQYCDRFLFLREGRVFAAGGPEVLTPENIRAVYGLETEILTHRGRKWIVPV